MREEGDDIEQDIAVSVIIPVYNAAPYLRQCLDSVLNQTLREIEILCVDDGSTDASPEILREYAARDSRMRLLTQPKFNAGAARNRGLDAARGRYLSFLDADDFFEPEMLKLAYEKAEKERAEILVFRCNNYITEEDRYTDRTNSIEAAMLPDRQPFAGTEMKGNLFLAFVGWAWDKLFLRDYLQEHALRFQEQRTTNDLFFTYFALARANRIVTIDELLAHHRIQVCTSLEATRDQSWYCFFTALRALRDGLLREGLLDRFERDFVNYAVSFTLWNLHTISWPTQEVLFQLLKNTWFQQLGVTGHTEEFFTDREQYRQLRMILDGEYAAMFPDGNPVPRLQAELDWQRAETAAIRASATYKIGRVITYIPRRMREFIHRRKADGRTSILHKMLLHIRRREKIKAEE